MCIILPLLFDVNPACIFGEFLKKIETFLPVKLFADVLSSRLVEDLDVLEAVAKNLLGL